MTDKYKYELPELPTELRHAQTPREQEYLKFVEDLRYKIQRDFATGLLHAEEFERQTGEETGVYIFVDGDGLKKINDTTQDHAAGTAAIKALARGIENELRARDDVTVARAGGDEFVIFVKGASLSTGVSIATRILASIRREKIIYNGDEKIQEILSEWPLSASLGVGRTRDEADSAMYRAKQNGRNRVEFFKPTDSNNNKARLEIAELAMNLLRTGHKELSDKLIESLQEL